MSIARVVTLQRPEVVPVRMHRLRRIALVADRRRQQPVERCARPARDWRRCARTGAARPGSARPRRTCGHMRVEQRAIARVAIDLGGEKDELAVAVVLGHRIGAARVDAARHLAVGELMRRVPAQVVGRRRRRGRGAAATPPSSRRRGSTSARRSAFPAAASGRRASSGCARATCAACRPAAARPAGTRERDAIELLAPRVRATARCSRATHASARCGRSIGGARRCRTAARRRRSCVCRAARSVERDSRARPTRSPIAIVHATRAAATSERASSLRQRPGVERERADAVRARAAGTRLRCAVDGERACRPTRCRRIGADAARRVQELRRRIDLERPHREHERRAAAAAPVRLRDVVARDELRRCARRRRRTS